MWDWSTFIHYLHSFYLIKGAGISLALSIGAMAIGLMLGTIAALMRRSRRRLLRGLASFYVWLFRGTPVLVQLIIIYTGLPQLGLKLGAHRARSQRRRLSRRDHPRRYLRRPARPVRGGARHRHDPRRHDARRGDAAGAPYHHPAPRQRLQRADEDVLSRVGDLDGGTAASCRIAHPGAVQGAGDLHRGRALLFGAHHAVGLRAGSSAS